MKPTRIPLVKICCISSVEEAAMAIECGASALGLVSHMPSGPGVIGEDRIAEIAARNEAANVGGPIWQARDGEVQPCGNLALEAEPVRKHVA